MVDLCLWSEFGGTQTTANNFLHGSPTTNSPVTTAPRVMKPVCAIIPNALLYVNIHTSEYSEMIKKLLT